MRNQVFRCFWQSLILLDIFFIIFHVCFTNIADRVCPQAAAVRGAGSKNHAGNHQKKMCSGDDGFQNMSWEDIQNFGGVEVKVGFLTLPPLWNNFFFKKWTSMWARLGSFFGFDVVVCWNICLLFWGGMHGGRYPRHPLFFLMLKFRGSVFCRILGFCVLHFICASYKDIVYIDILRFIRCNVFAICFTWAVVNTRWPWSWYVFGKSVDVLSGSFAEANLSRRGIERPRAHLYGR